MYFCLRVACAPIRSNSFLRSEPFLRSVRLAWWTIVPFVSFRNSWMHPFRGLRLLVFPVLYFIRLGYYFTCIFVHELHVHQSVPIRSFGASRSFGVYVWLGERLFLLYPFATRGCTTFGSIASCSSRGIFDMLRGLLCYASYIITWYLTYIMLLFQVIKSCRMHYWILRGSELKHLITTWKKERYGCSQGKANSCKRTIHAIWNSPQIAPEPRRRGYVDDQQAV